MVFKVQSVCVCPCESVDCPRTSRSNFRRTSFNQQQTERLGREVNLSYRLDHRPLTFSIDPPAFALLSPVSALLTWLEPHAHRPRWPRYRPTNRPHLHAVPVIPNHNRPRPFPRSSTYHDNEDPFHLYLPCHPRYQAHPGDSHSKPIDLAAMLDSRPCPA
jgi:hypothetical protein